MMAGPSLMLGGHGRKRKGKEKKKLGVGLTFTFRGVLRRLRGMTIQQFESMLLGESGCIAGVEGAWNYCTVKYWSRVYSVRAW